jgi:hypothetical protein
MIQSDCFLQQMGHPSRMSWQKFLHAFQPMKKKYKFAARHKETWKDNFMNKQRNKQTKQDKTKQDKQTHIQTWHSNILMLCRKLPDKGDIRRHVPAFGVSVAHSSISRSPGIVTRRPRNIGDKQNILGSPWVVVRTAFPFVAGSCQRLQSSKEGSR